MMKQKIKCIVWDLDDTLWKGVLLENDKIIINEHLVNVIKTLDKRGILNAIASRNDYATVKQTLIKFNLLDYFVALEVGWHDKSQSIKRIAESLNIGIDSFAFVDDQVFEREEVRHIFPMVHTYSPEEISKAIQDDIFIPSFITNESSLRRRYYQDEIIRKTAQETFEGSNVDFLRTLKLTFTIKHAAEENLQRAEELTMRTHQLNTSGVTYSYSELSRLIDSDSHILYICSLEDKFGSYGIIGLVLMEVLSGIWRIKLMLMSCRVLSRNVGNVLICFLNNQAKVNKIKLQAEFIHTEKNRQMYITYKFNGFNEILTQDNYSLLELDSKASIEIPNYVKINNLTNKEVVTDATAV